jgi:hypothetical protein
MFVRGWQWGQAFGPPGFAICIDCGVEIWRGGKSGYNRYKTQRYNQGQKRKFAKHRYLLNIGKSLACFIQDDRQRVDKSRIPKKGYMMVSQILRMDYTPTTQ